MNNIESRVKDVIAQQLGVKEESLYLDLDVEIDLGADSLDFTEILLELEEEFNINLPHELKPPTIKGYISLVEKTLKDNNVQSPKKFFR
jgi:acyl carrier protein